MKLIIRYAPCKKAFLCCCLLLAISAAKAQNKIIVFQTDFGLKDGAVSAMKGVSMGVDSSLKLFDLTHEIPAFNIWEAAYRLEQTIAYWPAGTVFVSVVDPGVGTSRKSVVVKTKKGHFIVTPDNGTLTLIAESQGIEEIRQIDETRNRRSGSEASYTFHGRDVYAFTAAKLAAGLIDMSGVGPKMDGPVSKLPYEKADMKGTVLYGTIPILDIQYGNVWTNIPDYLLQELEVKEGTRLQASIFHRKKLVYKGTLAFQSTFGAVPKGTGLAYLNSLMQLSFAINEGNFAKIYQVGSGNDWSVEIRKVK